MISVGRCLPIGAILVLAACAPHKILSVQDYAASFLCADGEQVRIRFVPFNAWIDYRGTSVVLVQEPAVNGFFYRGAGHSLRQKEHEVVWTDDKGAVRRCRDVSPVANNPIHALRTE